MIIPANIVAKLNYNELHLPTPAPSMHSYSCFSVSPTESTIRLVLKYIDGYTTIVKDLFEYGSAYRWIAMDGIVGIEFRTIGLAIEAIDVINKYMKETSEKLTQITSDELIVFLIKNQGTHFMIYTGTEKCAVSFMEEKNPSGNITGRISVKTPLPILQEKLYTISEFANKYKFGTFWIIKNDNQITP